MQMDGKKVLHKCINFLGIAVWLASRNVNSNSNNSNFNVRNVNTSGVLNNNNLCNVNSDGNTNANSNSNGLRPCSSYKLRIYN